MVVCLFLNVAVVKGKSASWVELVDAGGGFDFGLLLAAALPLMFVMAH